MREKSFFRVSLFSLSLSLSRLFSLALARSLARKKKKLSPGQHGPGEHRQVDRVRADHPHAQVRQLKVKVPLPRERAEPKGRKAVESTRTPGARVGREKPLEG